MIKWGPPKSPLAFWGEGGARKQVEIFPKKKNEAKRTLLRREGYQNLIRINKEKRFLFWGKKIFCEN